MAGRLTKTLCKFDEAFRSLLESAIDKLGLSARAFNRVLKIDCTIAGLEGEKNILVDRVSEVIQYGKLDRGSQFK